MTTRLHHAIFLPTVLLVLGCSNSAPEDTEETSSMPSGKKDDPSCVAPCEGQTDADLCLGNSSCGWGDRGAGLECFYVGNVKAQLRCAALYDEESCLSGDNCLWESGLAAGCVHDGTPAPQVACVQAGECSDQENEASCLALGGCAWGSDGIADTCIDVGDVVPQTSPCSTNPDESSCLANDDCAWGDQGAGFTCIEVGAVVAQDDECTSQTDEATCLSVGTCAWGDQGAGLACIMVGHVSPQDACGALTDEDACLDQTGCAWADNGTGFVCLYVGFVVPQ